MTFFPGCRLFLSDVIKSIVHHTKKYEEEIIMRGMKDRVDRSREMEILSVETLT